VALRISSQKDFWTGVIYVAVGSAAFLIARQYSFGSAGRMGPGYFPSVISSLLVLVGVIAVIRSFLVSDEPIGAFAFKQTVVIIAAVLAFGLLINTAGLIVALLVLVLLSARASAHFRFDWLAVLGLIALIIFCALLFVRALGVPMPLFGSWLAPFLPTALGT
jgi:Tripartite tricarboxylate transporter TctB family